MLAGGPAKGVALACCVRTMYTHTQMTAQLAPPKLLKSEVATLVRRLVPAGKANLVGTVGPDGSLNSPDRLDDFASYIRGMIAGRVAQPAPEKAWRLGLGVARATRARWCNPVLMLFYFGHFAHYAHVMLCADDSLIGDGKRLEMARTVMTVIDELPGPAFEEVRERVLAATGNELYAHLATSWEEDTAATDRADRAAWQVDGAQLVGLVKAWDELHRDGLREDLETVLACKMLSGAVMADKSAIDLATRKKVAAGLVVSALVARNPRLAVAV